MRFQKLFQDRLGCSCSEEVFEYLMATLKDTITKWDYFVNWTKCINGIKEHEKNLHLLNYLVGKDNIEEEAVLLLTEYPKLVSTIPLLLACRDNRFQILKKYKGGHFVYDAYDFKFSSSTSPKKATEFLQKAVFLEQLRSKRITSLVDYVFGVEVGLDSNGRKNRGGTAMEDIVEFFVASICKSSGYEYMTQATAPIIREKWGFNFTVDKSTRRIDFAIKGHQGLFLIETNFYGGGGSKLKSTAGEYRTLYRYLSGDGHQFIWITDGAGWNTTRRPLEETFNSTDYILNLDMLERGILADLLES